MARPFLKWAGGKSQLLPELLARSPRHLTTYYEPFLGGGALFFALASREGGEAPRRAVLADSNRDLIATYEAVRDDLEGLCERLVALETQYLGAGLEGRAEVYYCVRGERPRDRAEVAARLIFLNKTCYNGLYRVNRKGEFNVPHGRYRAPRILDREGLLAASRVLADVELRCADFELATEDARAGDFVYFDPPFHPLTRTSSFTAYTEAAFGRDDQLRLKQCTDRLATRGVAVMLSNSPHPWVVGGYEFGGYRVERISARRSINSRGSGRGAIDELVVTSYGANREMQAGA